MKKVVASETCFQQECADFEVSDAISVGEKAIVDSANDGTLTVAIQKKGFQSKRYIAPEV
jgi:hypothetical protein